MMKKQVHVIISGRVQGVWYRTSTKNQAEMLNLTGWVKNLESGEVEAVFKGDKKDIDKMLTWCQQGPAQANVTNVRITELEKIEPFTTFSIRY